MIAVIGINKNAIQEIVHKPKKNPRLKKIITAIKGIKGVNLNLSNAIIDTMGMNKKTCHAYAQPSSNKPRSKKIII
jgi:hypothetical protein